MNPLKCHGSVLLIRAKLMIKVIIVIALKGAIEDFYNLPTVPGTVSNMYTQVVRAQSCTNHIKHIKHLSRATCCVP